MNDQDFDFQSPQDPKDPKSQVSPALLAALGVTLVLAGGYYFWNSSGSTASPTAAAPVSAPAAVPQAPAEVPSRSATATVPKTPTPSAVPADAASAAPTAASPTSPGIASKPVEPTSTVAAGSGSLIPSSNAQFLTNQAIKIAGREDPFKSAVAAMPAPPVAPQPPLGPPPPITSPGSEAKPAPLPPPLPAASTVPIKGIFQVQQDAYVVLGHEGGDEILRAGEYLDSPDQIQVVRISPSAHTVTFREKGKDIVRNVEASP